MTQVSDNFNRANGALGGAWSIPFPNATDNMANALTGSVLINGDGYGPINAGGGDAYSIYQGLTFGNNQWAIAYVNSVAPYTSTIAITGCTQSAGNTVYNYTLDVYKRQLQRNDS